MRKPTHSNHIKKVLVLAAALALVLGCATVAYAADVGGIQRTVQLWIEGEQTNATIEFDGKGNYEMEYIDADGVLHERGGGGVAFDIFGRERPLTEEELLEELNSPDVIYEEDGRVKVVWYDQTVDITDKFVNEFCRVKLVNGDQELYMVIRYKDGFATSSHKYPEY